MVFVAERIPKGILNVPGIRGSVMMHLKKISKSRFRIKRFKTLERYISCNCKEIFKIFINLKFL